MKMISRNKKASYEYFLTNSIEAGIVFNGRELKSVINNGIDLTGTYVSINDYNVHLIGATIVMENEDNNIQTNQVKLLLHKREINKLAKLSKEPGYTLLCTDIHITENGKLKATIQVGKGKKDYNKRNVIKQRDIERYGN